MKFRNFSLLLAVMVAFTPTAALLIFAPTQQSAAPQTVEATTLPTDNVREFATAYGAGELVIAINPDNGHIAAFLSDEANNTGAGYAVNAWESSEVAHGTFTLTRRGVFNGGTFPESITLTLGIPSSNALVVVMDESGLSLPERPGHPCFNASGTGQCNNVNNRSDWWRCFRCCALWDILQNPCGDFV